MKHFKTFEGFLFENAGQDLLKKTLAIIKKASTYGSSDAKIKDDAIIYQLNGHDFVFEYDPTDKDFPIKLTHTDEDGNDDTESFEEFKDADDFDNALGDWETNKYPTYGR
jgi:hypothetical protein